MRKKGGGGGGAAYSYHRLWDLHVLLRLVAFYDAVVIALGAVVVVAVVNLLLV